MYKDILQSIEGISVYPIISLIVFVLFFAVILIWMIKVDKKYINKMENLPFENEEANNFNTIGDLYDKKV
jgi:Ca2+/Na+ antiporter